MMETLPLELCIHVAECVERSRRIALRSVSHMWKGVTIEADRNDDELAGWLDRILTAADPRELRGMMFEPMHRAVYKLCITQRRWQVYATLADALRRHRARLLCIPVGTGSRARDMDSIGQLGLYSRIATVRDVCLYREATLMRGEPTWEEMVRRALRL